MKSDRVSLVHRIIQHVSEQVHVASCEENWILGGPATGLGIVVAQAEAHELRIAIIQPTRKPERLEARIRVQSRVTEFVIVNPLGDRAGRRIDDEPRTPQVVGDDPVGNSTLDHIFGDVGPRRVDKAGHYVVAAVKFGDRLETVLVQEALGQRAIHLLADAAIVAVDQIDNLRAARQSDCHQIAQGVVLIGRRLAADSLALKFPVSGIGVGGGAVLKQAVLVVIAAIDCATRAGDA